MLRPFSAIFVYGNCLLLLLLLSGCCNKRDTNSGEIERELKIIGQGNSMLSCQPKTDTFCLRSDSAYKAFFKTDSTRTTCPGYDLPVVDFSKNSLLGFFKLGRNDYFQRRVTIDRASKKVIYEITTTSCRCADVCIRASMNAVLIPKIGNDYTVEFR